MDPKKLTPLYIFLALFHAAAIITRFDLIAAKLPAGVGGAILLAHFPLLFIAGYFESRLDYGEQMESLPLWMRVKSRPVKIAFTLATTYLGVAILQTWNIKFGPIAPVPPPEWDVATRVRFFAIMTGAFLFPNYLLAARLIIPALRGISRPLANLPMPVALAILIVAGAAVGVGVVTLAGRFALKDHINLYHATLGQRPGIALGLTFLFSGVPLIWGLIAGRGSGE